MFTAQAAKWHDNPIFWLKMLLLILATVFQLCVRGPIAASREIGGAKLIGAISPFWCSGSVSVYFQK